MDVKISYPEYPRIIKLPSGQLVIQTAADASALQPIPLAILVAVAEIKRLSKGNRKMRLAAGSKARKVDRQLPTGVTAADVAFFL